MPKEAQTRSLFHLLSFPLLRFFVWGRTPDVISILRLVKVQTASSALNPCLATDKIVVAIHPNHPFMDSLSYLLVLPVRSIKSLMAACSCLTLAASSFAASSSPAAL